MIEKAATRIPVKLHRNVILIQTEDAVLTEELLAHKKLSQDIVGRLSECVLLVRVSHGRPPRLDLRGAPAPSGQP